MNLSDRKIKLAQLLFKTMSQKKLDEVSKILGDQSDNDSDDLIQKYGSTYQEIKDRKFDLEEIKREQGYTGLNLEKMRQIAEEMDIQEPLEKLLKDLKDMG